MKTRPCREIIKVMKVLLIRDLSAVEIVKNVD
jgi:hypothetical protein